MLSASRPLGFPNAKTGRIQRELFFELANDTRFGLAAGIATERTSIAHNAAADLDAGLVYVNEYDPILPEAPYGGFKASDIGNDLGTEVLEHYQRTKSVYVNLSEPIL